MRNGHEACDIRLFNAVFLYGDAKTPCGAGGVFEDCRAREMRAQRDYPLVRWGYQRFSRNLAVHRAYSLLFDNAGPHPLADKAKKRGEAGDAAEDSLEAEAATLMMVWRCLPCGESGYEFS